MPVRRRVMLVLAALAATVVTVRPARAQQAPDSLELGYLVDGGAIPFFWIPLGAAFTIDRYVEPRQTPLWFDPSEGGEPSMRARELPNWTTRAAAGGVAAAILLDGDPLRYYHVKGLGQAVVMTSLGTVSGKRGFGRHRPDYDAAGDTADGRKSFPSGHSSASAAALTYLALYLRGHTFDRWRPRGTVVWWEVATYAGIGTLAAGVAYERVYHNRHHLSDAVVGSLLGASCAVVFYTWQERRGRRALERWQVGVAPTPGAQLTLSGTF